MYRKSREVTYTYAFAKNALIFDEHIRESDRCSIIPHDLYSKVSVHVYVLQISKVQLLFLKFFSRYYYFVCVCVCVEHVKPQYSNLLNVVKSVPGFFGSEISTVLVPITNRHSNMSLSLSDNFTVFTI